MVERLPMEVVVHFIYPLEHQRIQHNVIHVDEHHRYVGISRIKYEFFFFKSFHPIETHRDSVDNRYTSNVVANRFKPLMTYTNPNSSTFDRSTAIVNLPPASSPTSLTMRSGHLIRKEQSDVDHLTKLLMKSMNSSNEPNFFGELKKRNFSLSNWLFLQRNVCSM
jgi:hypothetical protein